MKIIAEIWCTTGKRKQYDSDEESASSGEEKEEEEEEEAEEEEEEYEVEDDSTKKEDCSNEVFSKTKNVQKASSTPPLKRQLTVMETLQINKMKQDKEAGDKKKKRKRGKNTAEVTAEKSHFLQQVAEYVSKKHGRGQFDCEFLNKMSPASHIRTLFSLVVKNISCKWKCCILLMLMRGRAWMGIKYTLVLFFVEYGAVAKKTPENKCLT